MHKKWLHYTINENMYNIYFWLKLRAASKIIRTTPGTMRLPGAHSVNIKGRVKFLKKIRVEFAFQKEKRDTFNDISRMAIPK